MIWGIQVRLVHDFSVLSSHQQKSFVERYTCCGKTFQLLEWTFDWNYMVRGLVLDKKRGNILKVSTLYMTFIIIAACCLIGCLSYRWTAISM